MTDALTTPPYIPETHGPWLSVTDLARRKGVTKQSASERVARFVAAGVLTTRPGPHRTKLVDLAEYDRAASEHSFPARQLAAETVRQRRGDLADGSADAPLLSDAAVQGADAGRPSDPTMTEAHAHKARIETQLKMLDLAERRKALVAIGGPNGVEAAQIRAGMAIVRALERIPARSAEVTAAALKEGDHAVRRLLRQLIVEVREAAAAELGAIKTEGLVDEHAGSYEVEVQLEDAGASERPDWTGSLAVPVQSSGGSTGAPPDKQVPMRNRFTWFSFGTKSSIVSAGRDSPHDHHPHPLRPRRRCRRARSGDQAAAVDAAVRMGGRAPDRPRRRAQGATL